VETREPEALASPFFVLRTPLLPVATLLALSSGLRAPAAWRAGENDLEEVLAHDRRAVGEGLRALALAPIVREALFLASPSFDDGLEAWLADPDGARAHHVTETLLRYVTRMCARPTPFGLFAGCSVGAIADHTTLELEPAGAYRKRTRFDMHYLTELAQGFERDPALRGTLKYRPNSTLYWSAGQIRYAEGRIDPETKERRNDLVSVDGTPQLEAALQRAAEGATSAEVARAVVERLGPDVADEAREYVSTLVDNQVLVSEMAPDVTGGPPVQGFVDTLSARGQGEHAESLRQAQHELLAMDAAGLGVPVARYRAFADRLRALPAAVDPARLLQVDLFKPAPSARIGPAVLREIERGVELLYRVCPGGEPDSLRRFRESFARRYGNGEVPLTVALDHERGVGFETDADSSEPSPLLVGLPFQAEAGAPSVPFGAREQWLVRRWSEIVRDGGSEWVLEDRDLAALDVKNDRPRPDAFAVMASFAASSSSALDAGEFRVWLHGTTGPSGARLLGRFCTGDDELRRRVEEHLAAEEALRPDAIFAEIVHLPQGRLGNVLCRPVLRRFEIPYLARSGAPEERQIPLSDLRVSVPDKMGERIQLRSARLGKEVLVRLTSAHNYLGADLPIYRFFCALQAQGTCGGLAWSWGPLEGAPWLPRVTRGKLVLSLARWHVASDEIDPLLKSSGAARYREAQRLRERRRLPRWVSVSEADHVLPLDLDSAVAVDVLLQLSKNRKELRLTEIFFEPGELCVRGPEGLFSHEVIVPVVRSRGASATAPPPEPTRQSAHVVRSYAPGSEWLYARIFTGTVTADAVLTELVRPLIERTTAAQAVDRWFFIRYGEGGWQVRLRLHGDPRRLAADVLPALSEAIEPWQDGRVWRLELDTYDREVERYGGEAGIDLAERVFHVDSEAVVAIVDTLGGDEGQDARWRVALVGIDHLLDGLGLDLASRIETMTRLRRSFGRTHRVDTAFEARLGAKFRAERRRIEPLVIEGASEPLLAAALAALASRKERLDPLLSRLRERDGHGQLTVPLPVLADSYVHMFVNRLLRSDHLAHELVLYDFLLRLYESKAARLKARVTGR
jgi:thiopeptide-type bacteriocin biosynthesis protein